MTCLSARDSIPYRQHLCYFLEFMDFKFSSTAQQQIQTLLKKYPKAREESALVPLLDLAQRENCGYLSKEAMEEVAKILNVPYMRVYEVATFYTMFNLKPVGKYHIKVCGTTPCWLRGAGDIMELCKNNLKIDLNQTTPDGLFSLCEFECLGACVNAPVVQINDDYIEDLTPDAMSQLLDDLKQGQPLNAGSCIKRAGSKAKV